MPQSRQARLQIVSRGQELIGAMVGRYVVSEQLGGGGMGEVYKAEDTVLKRPVALKRIAPQLRADPHYRDRFLKEAERASRVNHRNLATVHDVVEEGGEAFLVMEYVEGQNLRQRLTGPLPLHEFLKIAFQCIEGLAAAHDLGILHCDIKPENIMLDPAGRVKLLDFGLAKLLPSTDPQATVTFIGLSQGGFSGTPAYMAPEVLEEKAPDQRSDIFALGVVFHEALSGRNPFSSDTFLGIVERIQKATPPRLSLLNPEVPAAIERIICKMIEKRPVDRYGSVAELLADFQKARAAGARPLSLPQNLKLLIRPWRISWRGGLAILILAGLLGLTLRFNLVPAFLLWPKQPSSGMAMPVKTPVAVLSFTSSSNDPSTVAFSQGVSETVTAKLTQLTDRYPLQVVPASEIQSQHVGTVEQARANFGADLVVEGNMQVAGAMVRINYSLVDANTRIQLRADTVTAKINDPFAVQDSVVKGVLDMLVVELRAQDRGALFAHGTDQPEAYDFYLRGRGYLRDYEKPENIESAIAVFNRALDHDPKYALAYAGLGESYWHKYEYSHENEWLSKATAACEHAVRLGKKLANGYICLGMVENAIGEYGQAAKQFRRALELEPTSDDSYRGLAFSEEHLDNFAEAEATYRRAIGLRPHYWAGYNWLGRFLLSRGRYGESVEMFGKVVELAPDSFRGYSNLGGSYLAWGRYSEALPMLERSVAIRRTASALSNAGVAYFYLRRYAEAARAYEDAVRLDNRNFIVMGNLAEAYYYIPDRRAQAIATYKQAIALAEHALTGNPRDSLVVITLAGFYAMTGEREKAIHFTRSGVELAPKDPEILLNAALVFAQLREDAQTILFLKRALAAGLPHKRILDSPGLDRFASNPSFMELVRETQLAKN